MFDSLGDRMKNNYENVTRNVLVRRMPVIMRIDGKAFHTLTRGCEKPFDINLSNAMVDAASTVMDEAMGSKLAYIQSDEISILLTDYDNLESESWFNNNVQKLCSVAASIATMAFNNAYKRPLFPYDTHLSIGYTKPSTATFDCRVFNIPKEEVNNYFIWRQQDWMRNSVQMLARHYYSQKELHNKNNSQLHDMIMNKGVNWAKLEPARWKNGTVILRGEDVIHEDFIFKEKWDEMNKIVGL